MNTNLDVFHCMYLILNSIYVNNRRGITILKFNKIIILIKTVTPITWLQVP